MNKTFKDITGLEFCDGKIKVIEYSHKNTVGRHYYKVKCLWGYKNCIGEFFAEGRNLRSGGAKSCGCKRRHEHAQKLFGRKDTLVHKINRKEGLKKKQDKICQRFSQHDFDKATLLYVNSEYLYYKHAAKQRRISFELSHDEFLKLISASCYYCGVTPTLPTEYINAISVDRTKFHRNGVDRVNNSIGYYRHNCVTACEMCNMAKNNTPVNSFLSWIERVYKHQTGLMVPK